MRKNLFKTLTTIILFGCMVSCQNEEEVLQDLDSPEDVSEVIYNDAETIRTDGRYLDFKSFEEFERISDYQFILDAQDPAVDKTNLKHPKEVANEVNFYSLGHLFEEITVAQERHLNQLVQTLNEEELTNLGRSDEKILFASIVLENKDILNLDFNTGKVSLKQYDRDLAYLLNRDGVVLVQGGFYQYSDSFTKMSPYSEEFDMNTFLKTNANDPEKQIFFDEVIIESSEDSKVGERSTSCRGYLPNTRLHVRGVIDHVKSIAYAPNCTSDDWCWQTTGQVQCCGEPIRTLVSRIYAENTSYTSCAVSLIGLVCIGGEARQNIPTLETSLNYSYRFTRSNILFSNSFEHVSNNVSRQTVSIYSGERVNEVSVNATFSGTWSSSTGSCSTSLVD